jgi:hypothetical protein
MTLTHLLFQAHPFLVADSQREVDMAGWVARALAHREAQQALSSGAQESASTGAPSV